MSKPVILCVDDEAIIIDALKEQLQRSFTGYDIETAESGDEALEIISELVDENVEIPIVISDYLMPGMNGDVLLKKIHEIIPDTLKIMLTGQATIEAVGNAINYANLYRYITKPWEQNDLVLTVKEAVKSYYRDVRIRDQNKKLAELNSSLEKKVEERTLQLKELNATKDKFFSIIAHDLKNPFNAVMGFADLILSDTDGTVSDKTKTFATQIFEGAQYGYNLLENLLQWARSQTGALKINKQKVILNELVEENILLLNYNALNKGVELKNNLQTMVEVFVDMYTINTVIRNLISNAIKYTKSGGEVAVNVVNLNNDFYEVIISDTGIGISKENLAKLFRIDVNFTTTGTSNEQGTGLGLILCREFVMRNDGEIRIESAIGEGSKFIFTLPKRERLV